MMKYFTLSLFFFLVIPFGNSQIIVDKTLMGEYSVEDLEVILDDFGVPPGIVSLDFEIEVYKVTYNTSNATGTGMTIATGVCAFPKGYFCNLPIAAYVHGTTSSKTGVPSYGSDELNIGLLWAGGGYVSVLPDYLGLGDSPGLHPYVHSKSEATATIDLIRAAKEIGTELERYIGDDLFVFGYSQGGHAALATHKEIQENHADEMVVTASIGMSGPYDVAGVQTDFINSGEPYATPGYLPYIFLGYQEVYGDLYTNSVSEALVEPYATTLPPLFDGTNGMGTINNQCASVPTDMVQPDYQADFNTNPNNPFRLALEDNSLIHWTPMTPVRMFYCDQDEQVYYRNSEVARDSFVARGAPDIHAKNFGPYDHGGCLQFCLLNALFVMDSFKTGPNVLLDYVASYEESSAGAMDGSIQLFPNANAGNLTYVWSTGATSNILSNVGSGEYMVTITDETNCEANFTFNFDALLSNGNPEVQDLNFFPNPASDKIGIQLPVLASYQLEISDISGRLIKEQNFRAEGTYEVDLSKMNSGMYFIQVINDSSGETYIGKLLKD